MHPNDGGTAMNKTLTADVSYTFSSAAHINNEPTD